jgi:polysaccharide biosynthesis protein PslG
MAAALMCCLLAWVVPSATSAASPRTSAASSSSLLTGVSIGNLGYGTSPTEIGRELAWAEQLKAKVVRLEVPWAVMEPRAAGQVQPGALAFTDRLFAAAAADHIKLIMMVEDTPCWASSAPASLLRKCIPERPSAANAWPPSEPGAYAAFVAYLAQRYGSQLAAIEIWNEPDQANESYFAGPEKAARYAAVLRAAYTAIKQANPSVLVLGGSIVGVNGKFLSLLYKDGIKGYYDGLSVHFYTMTVAAVRYIHEVQLANGDSTPIWLDEFGFSSCWPGQKIQQEQACVTKQLQGVDLTDTVRLLARLPYVAATVAYKLQASNGEDFGMLSSSGAHKPAFAALSSAFADPLGPVGKVTVKLHRSGAQLVAGGSAPPGEYMELEAFRGSLLRYRSVFTLNRFNQYSLRLPSVLGTSGLRVRVYQYGQGTAHATQSSI